MKKLSISAVLILATAVVVPMVAKGQQTAKFVVNPSKHDIGQVFERATYEYTFAVRNGGGADLVIDDVKPGCGCTVAKFDKVIPPGGSGQITLILDGEKVAGAFQKSAQVFTNDPDNRQATITIAGFEVPYVNVAPEGTIYLMGRYGEPTERVLTLTSNEKDLDFKILSVTSNVDDKITYVLEDTAPGAYSLHLYKNPKLPTMATYGSVFLHTNSKAAPVTELQVQVMVRGDITVSPATLNFGAVKFADDSGPGTPATKSLIVTKSAGSFHIQNVTVSNPAFAPVVAPVDDGKQYRLQVTFTPPQKKQPRHNESAEMIIHTDDPREPAIRVQVIARSM